MSLPSLHLLQPWSEGATLSVPQNMYVAISAALARSYIEDNGIRPVEGRIAGETASDLIEAAERSVVRIRCTRG